MAVLPTKPDLTADLLIEDFEFLDDWTDRYRYLIDLGKMLPELDAAAKTDGHLVRGCQSRVWLIGGATEAPDGGTPLMRFHADSDAFLVKGIVAVLLIAMSEQPPAAVLAFDEVAYLDALGLSGNLSPSRTNGLYAMVTRIKSLAAAVA